MSSTKCRHQHHGAATALDEPAAERMGQFKMGGGVQGETAMQVCKVLIHETARSTGAGVGDQQTHIKICCCGNEVWCAAGVHEIDADDAVRDVVGSAQGAAKLFEPLGGPGGQNDV